MKRGPPIPFEGSVVKVGITRLIDAKRRKQLPDVDPQKSDSSFPEETALLKILIKDADKCARQNTPTHASVNARSLKISAKP
ncbi:MAG: hypothetical protein WA829_17445 [Candidatus Acidiferrum sp.]